MLFRSQKFTDICSVLHHGQSLKKDDCKETLEMCSGALTGLCPLISFWLLYENSICLIFFLWLHWRQNFHRLEWEKNRKLFEASLNMLVKNETKNSSVTLKLFLKTQAGAGYSESLESGMYFFFIFFFILFSLSNFKDTVRRQVFRDGLYVLKGEMCWHLLSTINITAKWAGPFSDKAKSNCRGQFIPSHFRKQERVEDLLL